MHVCERYIKTEYACTYKRFTHRMIYSLYKDSEEVIVHNLTAVERCCSVSMLRPLV